MLYKHFTEKIIGLQDMEIENVEEINNSLPIFCHLRRKPHKCHCCYTLTDTVHDYRLQVIFLLSAKNVLFILRSVDIVAPAVRDLLNITLFFPVIIV